MWHERSSNSIAARRNGRSSDSEEKYAAALHRIAEAEAKLATAQEKH